MKPPHCIENLTCETCRHFCRHFVYIEKRYQEVPFGHCIFPRLKQRRSNTPACAHYQPRRPEDDG